MTLLTPFNRINQDFFNEFFSEPTFTRKIQTLDSEILANKENYSIWELPSGKYEIRVEFQKDGNFYHRASTKESLQEAEHYVDAQVKYHSRQVEGPKLVKSYKIKSNESE